MESRAKIAGHAIHPMLVVFPLGLLATAFVFDMIHVATKNPSWALVSYWMIAAGIIGGLAAAPFGWVDWLAIPDGTRAKSVGLTHGIGNVVVLLLFAASWYLRYGHETLPGTVPIVLAGAGVALALFTGWLGGELVERLGIGVDYGAHMDAPSSLSDHTAMERESVDIHLPRAS
jgi:uncharacterized membrane protein